MRGSGSGWPIGHLPGRLGGSRGDAPCIDRASRVAAGHCDPGHRQVSSEIFERSPPTPIGPGTIVEYAQARDRRGSAACGAEKSSWPTAGQKASRPGQLLTAAARPGQVGQTGLAGARGGPEPKARRRRKASRRVLSSTRPHGNAALFACADYRFAGAGWIYVEIIQPFNSVGSMPSADRPRFVDPLNRHRRRLPQLRRNSPAGCSSTTADRRGGDRCGACGTGWNMEIYFWGIRPGEPTLGAGQCRAAAGSPRPSGAVVQLGRCSTCSARIRRSSPNAASSGRTFAAQAVLCREAKANRSQRRDLDCLVIPATVLIVTEGG